MVLPSAKMNVPLIKCSRTQSTCLSFNLTLCKFLMEVTYTPFYFFNLNWIFIVKTFYAILQTLLNKKALLNESFIILMVVFRIKKGYPYEARVITRVLPTFLADFFPPQDIMNKIIGEFISSQQPYPQLIAMVVFQV